jgi:hypothetical protein
MEEREVRAIVEEMLTGLDPEFGYKVHTSSSPPTCRSRASA